ncbi:MAG TPA: hypothetical protein IGS52_15205 [Oscillatoriaceae cyanobacterium M33_DOE_052]|nr:hypothetical protein [Oscillatoriaceae cyanobacterium M33_DOE_052]
MTFLLREKETSNILMGSEGKNVDAIISLSSLRFSAETWFLDSPPIGLGNVILE